MLIHEITHAFFMTPHSINKHHLTMPLSPQTPTGGVRLIAVQLAIDSLALKTQEICHNGL